MNVDMTEDLRATLSRLTGVLFDVHAGSEDKERYGAAKVKEMRS
jgi:hypothetical protein